MYARRKVQRSKREINQQWTEKCNELARLVEAKKQYASLEADFPVKQLAGVIEEVRTRSPVPMSPKIKRSVSNSPYPFFIRQRSNEVLMEECNAAVAVSQNEIDSINEGLPFPFNEDDIVFSDAKKRLHQALERADSLSYLESSMKPF